MSYHTNTKQSRSLLLSIPWRPMLSALLRQKYSLSMLVLQIALTLAVISNGLFIVTERLEILQRTSGIDEANTFVLTSSGFAGDFNPQTSMQTDLAALRKMPNIVNAVATYAFPFGGGSEWDELQRGVSDDQPTIPAARYKLDEHGLEALGLSLIAGENFSASEVLWQDESNQNLSSAVIITASVAQALFDTQDWSSVVGQPVVINTHHWATVKGVVKQLQAPWDPVGQIQNSVIYPRVVTRNSARYFIRTQPKLLQDTMAEVERFLGLSNQGRMIRKVQSVQALKKHQYGPDIAAITILLVVIAALTIVAAMGIAGIASFNVNKRRKQIGIRRALGASRSDILSHFLAENVLQTTCGVALGCILAVALNMMLVSQYALPKLPLAYLLLAACCLYLIGSLATLKPAIKAMNIAPAEATRN